MPQQGCNPPCGQRSRRVQSRAWLSALAIARVHGVLNSVEALGR